MRKSGESESVGVPVDRPCRTDSKISETFAFPSAVQALDPSALVRNACKPESHLKRESTFRTPVICHLHLSLCFHRSCLDVRSQSLSLSLTET